MVSTCTGGFCHQPRVMRRQTQTSGSPSTPSSFFPPTQSTMCGPSSSDISLGPSSCPRTRLRLLQLHAPALGPLVNRGTPSSPGLGMVCLKNGRRGAGLARSLSLTVGEEGGLPGTQGLVELLNESQVVKVRENVHHPVIFQQVLEKERDTHQARSQVLEKTVGSKAPGMATLIIRKWWKTGTR